jgi:hypothetical protein
VFQCCFIARENGFVAENKRRGALAIVGPALKYKTPAGSPCRQVDQVTEDPVGAQANESR